MKKIVCLLMASMVTIVCITACRVNPQGNEVPLGNTVGSSESKPLNSSDAVGGSKTPESTGSSEVIDDNEEKNEYHSLTSLPAVGEYTDRLGDSFKVRRSMLNDVEKQLYDQFLPYVLSYTPFSVDYRDMDYDVESLMIALKAIRNDYPETWMYFADGTGFDNFTGNSVSHGSMYYNINRWYLLGREEFDKEYTSEYIKKVDDKCASILNQMPEGLSTKEKYTWIANYVCSITEYDTDTYIDYMWADGPLMYGKGICQSYSFAYQWLCQKAGLWCITCDGMVDGIGHCWNVVKLDNGKTYYMDLTWADEALDSEVYYYMSYAECLENRTVNDGEWIADGE